MDFPDKTQKICGISHPISMKTDIIRKKWKINCLKKISGSKSKPYTSMLFISQSHGQSNDANKEIKWSPARKQIESDEIKLSNAF